MINNAQIGTPNEDVCQGYNYSDTAGSMMRDILGKR